MAQPDTKASAGTRQRGDIVSTFSRRLLLFPPLVRGEPSSFRLGRQLWDYFWLGGQGVGGVTGPGADNMEGQEGEGLETEQTGDTGGRGAGERGFSGGGGRAGGGVQWSRGGG